MAYLDFGYKGLGGLHNPVLLFRYGDLFMAHIMVTMLTAHVHMLPPILRVPKNVLEDFWVALRCSITISGLPLLLNGWHGGIIASLLLAGRS